MNKKGIFFNNSTHGRQCGSTLILVLIMTVALSMVAGSLLKLGMTERRMNKSNILHARAQNAAESMVEYGFAELKTRWQRKTSFPSDALSTDPLTIPPTANNFLSGDGVVYDELQLVGGTVGNGEWIYIDPTEPTNINDPQKGKMVFSRGVDVYGKAVVEDATLGQREAYCMQTLKVRDAPLFTHAVFYNMDLEFHPGPSMDMEGPVHSNGDIYVQTKAQLRFHSTLNSAGDIIYGFKKSNGDITQDGSVYVKDVNGNWTSFYTGGDKKSKSSYVDSGLGESWRETATNRWGGTVASQDHGVPKMNPVGIGDYVPDNPETSANEKYNPAYSMIEPVVSTDHENFKGHDAMKQQLAYKAGLIFKVEEVPDSTAPGGYNYEVKAYKYDRARQTDPTSAPRFSDGKPVMEDLELDQLELELEDKIITVNRYAEDENGVPTGGFYDSRQEVGLDVIELDVGLLAKVINEGESATGNNDPWNGKYKLNPGSAVDWNGVVYVELPYDSSPSSRADKVMPADQNVALRLNNASEVPNPDFAVGAGIDKGFTLATNGQLYVKGHFNADGDESTGSATETDDGKTSTGSEASAALYADAITILSENFNDSLSKEKPAHRAKPSFTEVSAALVTGLVPAVAGSHESGGAHNLPRFLENWNGVKFRYRGSLVALYESEVATAPMIRFWEWYHPPRREWGYSKIFGYQMYPPGTPNLRDFRRTNFQFLTKGEYLDALSGIDGYNPNQSTHGHASSGL